MQQSSSRTTRALLVSLVGACALASLAATTASAATGDWTQFGFTADGRRNNTQETILGRKTVAQLTSKWSANIPVGTSSAAVANGIVYVGSTDNHLYAFDAGSGAPVWQAATGAPIMSSPAVASGVVYVGSNDGQVYAFDAETGALRWSTQIGTGSLVESPVTVAGGLVYAGTTNGNMVALSASTGAVKWTKTAVFSGETVAPALAHGIVYFANDGGELDALDARTGASLWMQRQGPGGFAGALAVGDGMVYGVSSGDLCAFDAATGVNRWWDRVGTVTGSIAIGAHYLYATSETGFLMDVSTANGAVKYTNVTHQPVRAAPALANGVLYAGSRTYENTISAYNTANGKLLWQAATDQIVAAPTVSNGMLYVGSASQFTAYGLP